MVLCFSLSYLILSLSTNSIWLIFRYDFSQWRRNHFNDSKMLQRKWLLDLPSYCHGSQIPLFNTNWVSYYTFHKHSYFSKTQISLKACLLLKWEIIFYFHFLLLTSPICFIYSIVRVCIATAAPHKFPEALAAADVPYVLPDKISRIFDIPTRCQFNLPFLWWSHQKVRSIFNINTMSCKMI